MPKLKCESRRTGEKTFTAWPDGALRVCLFGAALDTANLGVSALGKSVVHALRRAAPDSNVAVFDFGRGTDTCQLDSSGNTKPIIRCGAYHTRRIYRPESLWNIRVSAHLGGLWNRGARLLRAADAVLDITGGDSFTDLYGPWRFRAVTLCKQIALELGKPLVLLPQTYGPFASSRNRRIAQDIVRRSAMAWARDERSFDVLKELLGDAFDPARHRSGVDVAFSLPAVRPAEDALGAAAEWLGDKSAPLAGLNVSGLLMNRPGTAARQYGFQADYGEAVISLVRRLLKDSGARILLIPHVVTPPGHYESDIGACQRVADAVANAAGGRVAVLPALHDPCEVKWAISQLDWFCGTRMHSTIAALSSGVPAAAIAYSPKTLGVFETCGQGAHVADPRQLDTGEVVERLWQSWAAREKARESLQATLPAVLRRAEEQMDAIVAECVKRSTEDAEAGAPP